jgi:hypothetical protein
VFVEFPTRHCKTTLLWFVQVHAMLISLLCRSTFMGCRMIYLPTPPLPILVTCKFTASVVVLKPPDQLYQLVQSLQQIRHELYLWGSVATCYTLYWLSPLPRTPNISCQGAHYYCCLYQSKFYAYEYSCCDFYYCTVVFGYLIIPFIEYMTCKCFLST